MRHFFLGCLMALAGPVLGAEIKIDFGDSPLDQMPTNFESVLVGSGQPGHWTVVGDEVPSLFSTDKAPLMNQRLVLAQTSTDSADERFPVLVYEGDSFRDFKITTHFKIISGVSEQMAGLVFRYLNSSNFYVIRASALGHNIRFYSVVNGERSNPIGPQLDVSIGVWHTLTVQCSGTQINAWYDNNLVLPLNDPTFSHGKVGFWTKSDSVAYFSDLTIDYTPTISAAQTLVNNTLQKESKLLGLRIYTLNSQGQPQIIASKYPEEIGLAGSTAESAAITNGTVSLGRGPGTVAVWLPFRDRNGDPIAAIWVRLKSFFGETQDTAVTRATLIVKMMQAQIMSSEDLLK